MIRFEGDIKDDFRITVIGMGGASRKIVDTITGWEYQGIQTAFIDTKEIKELNGIIDSLPHSEITFVLTGMGGKTGTEVTPYVVGLLKKKSLWVWTLATIPFFFEGKAKIINSIRAVKQVQTLSDAVLVIPHDKVFNMVDRNIKMYKAFLPANDICIKCISCVYRLTMPSNKVGVDYSDIRRYFGHNNSTGFGFGAGNGENKVRQAVESAIGDILLGKELVSKAGGLIVSILGGDDLKLKEVQDGIDFLHTFALKTAEINFAVTVDNSFNNKVQISIIALGLNSDTNDISSRLSGVSVPNKQISRRKINTQPLSKGHRPGIKGKQTTIDFKSLFKGQFDKSKPTIYNGEDIDVPTFLRKKKQA